MLFRLDAVDEVRLCCSEHALFLQPGNGVFHFDALLQLQFQKAVLDVRFGDLVGAYEIRLLEVLVYLLEGKAAIKRISFLFFLSFFWSIGVNLALGMFARSFYQ